MGQFGSRCMNGWIVKWVSCQSLHKPIDRLPHGDNSLKKKKQIDFLAHFSPAPEEKLSHQHLNSKFGLFNGLQTSQTSCMRRGRVEQTKDLGDKLRPALDLREPTH